MVAEGLDTVRPELRNIDNSDARNWHADDVKIILSDSEGRGSVKIAQGYVEGEGQLSEDSLELRDVHAISLDGTAGDTISFFHTDENIKGATLDIGDIRKASRHLPDVLEPALLAALTKKSNEAQVLRSESLKTKNSIPIPEHLDLEGKAPIVAVIVGKQWHPLNPFNVLKVIPPVGNTIQAIHKGSGYRETARINKGQPTVEGINFVSTLGVKFHDKLPVNVWENLVINAKDVAADDGASAEAFEAKIIRLSFDGVLAVGLGTNAETAASDADKRGSINPTDHDEDRLGNQTVNNILINSSDFQDVLQVDDGLGGLLEINLGQLGNSLRTSPEVNPNHTFEQRAVLLSTNTPDDPKFRLVATLVGGEPLSYGLNLRPVSGLKFTDAVKFKADGAAAHSTPLPQDAIISTLSPDTDKPKYLQIAGIEGGLLKWGLGSKKDGLVADDSLEGIAFPDTVAGNLKTETLRTFVIEGQKRDRLVMNGKHIKFSKAAKLARYMSYDLKKMRNEDGKPPILLRVAAGDDRLVGHIDAAGTTHFEDYIIEGLKDVPAQVPEVAQAEETLHEEG